MGSFRRALIHGGLSGCGVAQGDVWRIANQKVRLDGDMAAERAPEAKQRVVLVMQATSHITDSSRGTVLVAPFTSSLAPWRSTSLLVPRRCAGLSQDSQLLLHLLQPVLIRDVAAGDNEFCGNIGEAMTEAIILHLLAELFDFSA